jgi:hypothetical protein
MGLLPDITMANFWATRKYVAEQLAWRCCSIAMPLYSFAVHSSHRRIESETSEPMPDDEAALEEAVGIIGDLKMNNAAIWRNGWTIEVTEGDRIVWQIPFI